MLGGSVVTSFNLIWHGEHNWVCNQAPCKWIIVHNHMWRWDINDFSQGGRLFFRLIDCVSDDWVGRSSGQISKLRRVGSQDIFLAWTLPNFLYFVKKKGKARRVLGRVGNQVILNSHFAATAASLKSHFIAFLILLQSELFSQGSNQKMNTYEAEKEKSRQNECREKAN